jgi:hypothetical protein
MAKRGGRGLDRVLVLALRSALVLTVGAGCAEVVGVRATKGAVEAMERKAVSQGGTGHPLRDAGHAAVEGAVEALSAPEQVARIQAVVTQAVNAAVADALRTATRGGKGAAGSLIETASAQAANAFRESLASGMAVDIEPERGALGISAAALSQKLTSSATEGALAGVAPGCIPREDPDCLGRHLRLLAHDSGRSMVEGARSALGLWPVVIAFVLGALLASFAVLGGSLWRRRRHPPGGMMAAPAPAGAA